MNGAVCPWLNEATYPLADTGSGRLGPPRKEVAKHPRQLLSDLPLQKVSDLCARMELKSSLPHISNIGVTKWLGVKNRDTDQD